MAALEQGQHGGIRTPVQLLHGITELLESPRQFRHRPDPGSMRTAAQGMHSPLYALFEGASPRLGTTTCDKVAKHIQVPVDLTQEHRI